MGRAFEYRKARKLKRWGTMAKTFTKIGREVAIAVKSGGPDPGANPRLRVLIQNAKAANMPKENVERAIKKASGKDQTDYKEVVYEGYAPHGIAVLVETATDNTTRTVANVRSYFNKAGGSLGTSGSVEDMFEHKCSFKVKMKEGVDLEELELELIDSGVQEIFIEDEFVMIYGDFEAFGPVQKYLEENGFEIENAEFERIPQDTKPLSEEQAADIEKLLARFEEDDDVTNVFHNMTL
jgi:YebC/PmpR family DNA-binding regulatory protein